MQAGNQGYRQNSSCDRNGEREGESHRRRNVETQPNALRPAEFQVRIYRLPLVHTPHTLIYHLPTSLSQSIYLSLYLSFSWYISVHPTVHHFRQLCQVSFKVAHDSSRERNSRPTKKRIANALAGRCPNPLSFSPPYFYLSYFLTPSVTQFMCVSISLSTLHSSVTQLF